jgi:predicted Zn-dependent peptidase
MKTRTFDNGFRLVYQRSFHGSNAASIQVICDVGSIHEAADSRGSAHFIEHMCFKGTPLHPSTFAISTIIDKTGSEINAFTDKRYTKYFIETNTECVVEYIQLLSDMLLNSIFDKKEYDKEKDVVREEMIKDADDAEIVALENVDGVIFAGSPFEYPVDELKYHVGKHVLQYDKIVEMYRAFYLPSRMILSVCSANSFESICAAVSKSFFVRESQKSVVACPSSPILSLVHQTDVVYKIVKMSINPAHICVGFRTCSIRDKDRYVLKMLRRILSGSLSSRLFMILREENGLTYSSYTSSDYYEHMGSFTFYAECDPEKIFKNGLTSKPGVLPLIIKLICDLIKDGVSKQELDNAKNSYRGKIILSAENASSVASYNAKNILFNAASPPNYLNIYSDCIKSITALHVNTAIKKYFRCENMVVSVVGRNPPSRDLLEKCVNEFM